MGYLLKNICGCMLLALVCGCANLNDAEKVTASNILKIDIGMSEHQVIGLLGEPVSKYHGGYQPYTYQYTEKGVFNYPMVWVHFDSSGVNEVYVKYYGIADDQGIYGLAKDTGGDIKQWGQSDLDKVIKQ